MLERILHWLGLFGFAVHESHEPQVAESKRIWGEPADQFVLGVALVGADLSVALKNLSATTRTLQIPDWMAFYHVRIDAPVSRYGQLLFRAAAAKSEQKVTILAGKFVETELPLSRLYEVEPGRNYPIGVTCTLGLTSKTIETVM